MSGQAPYITVTKGMRGYYVVMVWWHPDGFWEPYQTGIGSYETVGQAAKEGRDWAQAEELEFKLEGQMTETPITKETEYDWYKAKLGGKNPPTHEGHVQCGRFRMKQKDGPAVGVAVWRDWSNGGMLMASYDAKIYSCDEKAEPTVGPDGKPRPTNFQKLQDKWTWLAGQVIPPGLFAKYKESGYTRWPDESDAGFEQRAAAHAEKTNQPAPVTFTHPPDTFEGLEERLAKYGPQAEAMISRGEATDNIVADIAADLKNVMGGLEKTADDKRLAETMPLRQQVEGINAKWNVLVMKAKGFKANLAVKVISPWQAKEVTRLQNEQKAKIEEARANNVQVTEEMKAPPKVASGSMGRKVAPRSVCKAIITEPRAFLAFLAGNENIHAGIVEAMQRIADAGGSTDPAKCPSYPGVEYIQSTLSA